MKAAPPATCTPAPAPPGRCAHAAPARCEREQGHPWRWWAGPEHGRCPMLDPWAAPFCWEES